MRKSNIAALAAVAAVAVAVAGQAPAQAPRRPAPAAPAPARAPAQVVTGPVSTYWMSVETTAGFGAGMAGGGGGQPSLGSIMGMMRGGGGANHRLTLQLGSSTATPSPSADHTVPAGFGIGPKLPLLTPRVAPPAPVEQGESIPKEYQRPRGRMLIFWGCGERARPGQPLVFDFAQMAEGKIPAAAMGAMKGLNYTPMRPPSPATSKTYGEWPNERARQTPTPASSLVGPHAVAGTYTSPINFMLTPAQDFMPALGLRTAKNPSGSAQLTWTPAAAARGYLAMAVGGGTQDTVALWISSEGQAAAFGLPDYLSPADLQKLVTAKALMPAGSSSCVVPKEFVDVAPTAFVNLAGYGDEANFSSPPRPADPRTPWNIDWVVKVRYRTAESAILGMDMAAMGGGAPPAPTARGFPGQPAQDAPPPPASGDTARDAVIRGLGSAIGRGLLGGR